MQTVQEEARLAAVRRYDILDTPREDAFDRITTQAARVLDVPVALFTVIDERRIWVKSGFGTDLQATDRDLGFCASCILQNDPWLVADAAADHRTRTHALVCGPFGLRFYLGVPLRTADGLNLGTLCAIDQRARTCTPEDIAQLTCLARIVMDQLELRLLLKETRAAYCAELIRRELREDRIAALNRELAHRSKNLLALVLAIVRQTALTRPSLDDYVGKVSLRVQAIARTHDLLIRNNWEGATLGDLVRRHVGRGVAAPEQLRLSGPVTLVNPAAAQSIGLALHELASNSEQHGALTTGGMISLEWSIDTVRSELHLTWIETHAAQHRPRFRGFGHLVLERLTPQALDGTASLALKPGTAVWSLCCPLRSVERPGASVDRAT